MALRHAGHVHWFEEICAVMGAPEGDELTIMKTEVRYEIPKFLGLLLREGLGFLQCLPPFRIRGSDGIFEKALRTVEKKQHRVFTVALEYGLATEMRLTTSSCRGLVYMWLVTCEDGEFFPFLHVHDRIVRVFLITAVASFAQRSALRLPFRLDGLEVVWV